MLTRTAIPTRTRTVACRASAVAEAVVVPRASSIVLEDVPACPCVAAVDVFAAKAKCVHPARPVKDACPDCPRRKGRSMQAEAAPTSNVLEVHAAKAKCVHPARPLKDACPDCPRRKGKGVVAVQEALPCKAIQEKAMPAIGGASMRVFAAKSKCVHPTRPVKDACPDCPRRRK